MSPVSPHYAFFDLQYLYHFEKVALIASLRDMHIILAATLYEIRSLFYQLLVMFRLSPFIELITKSLARSYQSEALQRDAS